MCYERTGDMLETICILNKIKELRECLHSLVAQKKELTDSEVISASEKLDGLLNIYIYKP
jgi:hypothetical protein